MGDFAIVKGGRGEGETGRFIMRMRVWYATPSPPASD